MLQACLAAMRGPWQQVHPTATSTSTTTTTTSRSGSYAACYTAAERPASSSSTLGTPFSTTGIAAAHVHSGNATGSERTPLPAPYGPTPYPLLHAACRTLAALLTSGEDRTALMQWALAKMGGAEVLLGMLERGAGFGQKPCPEGEERSGGVVARLKRRLGLGLGGTSETAGDGEDATGGGGVAVSGCGVAERYVGQGEAESEGGQLALAALTVLRLLVHGTAMTQVGVADAVRDGMGNRPDTCGCSRCSVG